MNQDSLTTAYGINLGDVLDAPVQPQGEKHSGKVVYISPNRTFFRMEFKALSGEIFHECFCFFGPGFDYRRKRDH